MYRSEHDAAFARAVAAYDDVAPDEFDEGAVPDESMSVAELTTIAEALERRRIAKQPTSPVEDERREYAAALNDWYTAKREVQACAHELAAAATREGRSFSVSEVIGVRPKVGPNASPAEYRMATNVLRARTQGMRALVDAIRVPPKQDSVMKPEGQTAPARGLVTSLVPYRSYVIETSMSVEQARAAVLDLVGAGAMHGRMKRDGSFKLNLWRWYSNRLNPTALVRISAATHGASVFVRVRPQLVHAFFLFGWMAIAFVAAFAGVVAFVTGSFAGILACGPFVIGGVVFGSQFEADARQIEERLYGLYPACHPPERAYR